jgi:hypothetical protein
MRQPISNASVHVTARWGMQPRGWYADICFFSFFSLCYVAVKAEGKRDTGNRQTGAGSGTTGQGKEPKDPRRGWSNPPQKRRKGNQAKKKQKEKKQVCVPPP